MKVKITQLQGARLMRELEGEAGGLPEIGLRFSVWGEAKLPGAYAEFYQTDRVTDIIESRPTFAIFKTKAGSIYRLDY